MEFTDLLNEKEIIEFEMWLDSLISYDYDDDNQWHFVEPNKEMYNGEDNE